MTNSQQLDLASRHHQSGRLAEAEAVYRQILAVEPQNARALQLMGVVLHQRGNSAAGSELIRRAIQIDPSSPDFHSNLGVVLADCGQYDEALACYRQAVRLAPYDPDFHWNMAINLLSRGDFREGWDEFEWRLRSPGRNLNRGFPQPQWNGSDLTGKTILLHTEGGFGDAIQFIRYVPYVARRGGQIILDCQGELVRLFELLPGVSRVFRRYDALTHFDFQIPLQSLPRVFQTTLANIPADVPYLTAPQQSAQYWKEQLATEPGPKVGLVWAGSHAHSGRRTNSLEIFAPLAEFPGIRFFSLQKGPESKRPSPRGLSIVDYTDQMSDFADLAAFIDNLDLVISVDTSVAHLAGAMAKPVWTLVGYALDFRWLRNRLDSPWYPTMRLFRQEKGEKWISVVERVAQELKSRRPDRLSEIP
jgi:tetratricopeptide (TPR) repeat protein